MSQISIHDLQAMADKMASIDFSASVTIVDVPKSTSTQRASLFDTWDAALANLLPVVRNAVVIPGRDHGKQVELPDIGLDVNNSHAVALQSWLRLRLGSDDVVVPMPVNASKVRVSDHFVIRPPKRTRSTETVTITPAPADRPTVEQLANVR